METPLLIILRFLVKFVLLFYKKFKYIRYYVLLFIPIPKVRPLSLSLLFLLLRRRFPEHLMPLLDWGNSSYEQPLYRPLCGCVPPESAKAKHCCVL